MLYAGNVKEFVLSRNKGIFELFIFTLNKRTLSVIVQRGENNFYGFFTVL